MKPKLATIERVLSVTFAVFAISALAFGADSTLGSWRYDPQTGDQFQGWLGTVMEWGGQSLITSLTVTREAVGGGEVKTSITGQRANGEKIDAVAANGEVAGVGLPWDQFAVKHVAADKLTEERWKFPLHGTHLVDTGSMITGAKNYHTTVQIVVSKDGARVTWSSKGTGPNGDDFRALAVFYRIQPAEAK